MARVVDQPLAEIDGANLRVAPDFFRRALGDQAAAVEHQDAVGMFEHHVHVVLGEQHADGFFPRDPGGQPHQLDALARRHAGGRLIHQQKFGLIGECDGELQPLQIAIGEFAAGPLGIAAHADQFEQAAGFLARELRRRGPHIEQLPAIRHQRDLDVFAHRHGREGRGDLEGAADAEPPDLARLLAGGIAAEQIDAAGAGGGLAVQHIEAGAFAGAVGADQRQDFAGLQRERHVAHGVHAAIGFAEAFDRQQCGRGAHSALSIRDFSSAGFGSSGRRRLRKVSSMPTMPFGNATTISTMTPPSTSFERSVWLTSQIESIL